MAEEKKLLESLAEQLEYCERMLAMEARLDLVVAILEELVEKLSTQNPLIDEQSRRAMLERAKLTYHRAKTLLYLEEEAKGTKY
ncbi:MAG: hypothetical protein RMH74_08005 [Candidatus Caldarchaeum sp.]|nr:hypothetical protein [Candidatus Caldarchaeum sp.]